MGVCVHVDWGKGKSVCVGFAYPVHVITEGARREKDASDPTNKEKNESSRDSVRASFFCCNSFPFHPMTTPSPGVGGGAGAVAGAAGGGGELVVESRAHVVRTQYKEG